MGKAKKDGMKSKKTRQRNRHVSSIRIFHYEAILFMRNIYFPDN
ncbi:hypothetical protein HMPREF9447_03047 [Bacteroides oleiciplenus YIT 12058]|mgnify:CR=1 FL=1|uniref:Uncharacterized protein n=1 Tax=Bacteroides oleiciplenus YIT 12058 TaxID=742727 RepID=K9DX71_9BACE|nr:hypothetical protein HMPREF9447_03047 [Bacteroides oleiciplenus YIT 12058]